MKQLKYKINKLDLTRLIKYFVLDSNKVEDIPVLSQENFNRSRCSYLEKDNLQNDSSLFYQLLLEQNLIDEDEDKAFEACERIYKTALENSGIIEDLSKTIIYVSFGDLLTTISKKKDTYKQKIISLLLEPKKGFYVDFKEGNEIHRVKFVSFLKSNSMSKKSVISFVDERYYQSLLKRILVGFNLKNKKLSLTKFYAYTGLAMSGGIRLNINQNIKGLGSLILNEDTVVVVDDYASDLKHTKVRPIITMGTKENLLNILKNSLFVRYFLRLHEKSDAELTPFERSIKDDENFNLTIKRIVGKTHSKKTKKTDPYHKRKTFYFDALLKDIQTLLIAFGVKLLPGGKEVNTNNINDVIEHIVDEKYKTIFETSDNGNFPNIGAISESLIDYLSSYFDNTIKGSTNIREDAVTRTVILYSINTSPDNFDGEGLISPRYSNIINNLYTDDKYLKANKLHTSFQIRLPLVKGMLHTVDFKSFFEEECVQKFFIDVKNEEDIKYKDGIYHFKYGNKVKAIILDGEKYILDHFGVYRKLSNIEIILTEGQLKADKIISLASDETKSFMENYFENFHKYHHSLYITNADSIKHKEEELTALNYQFLSTSGLNGDDAYKITKLQREKIENLYKGDCEEIKKLFDINEDDDDDINEEAISLYDSDTYDNMLGELVRSYGLKKDEDVPLNKFAAILYNDTLKHTNAVINKVKDSAAKEISELVVGHVLFKGELRYLSGDLLLLLYTILGCKSAHIDPRERIRENDFYAPKGKFYNYVNNECVGLDAVLQRNPHISKNENTVSGPWIPFEGSLRNKYLSGLDFVCMINASSLIQERLGGADYDGDEVRIITDPAFVECVKKDRYSDAIYFIENDEYGYKPIIYETAIVPHLNVVPSGKAIFSGENIYLTLLNTFGSAVGQYSNEGFKTACIAYSKENLKDEEQQLKVVEYYLTVGLEVDSAKSGVKPKKPKQLVGDCENILDSAMHFLKIKDKYSTESKKTELWLEKSCPNKSNVVLMLDEIAKQIKNQNKIYKKDKKALKSMFPDLPILDDEITNKVKDIIKMYTCLVKTPKTFNQYSDQSLFDLLETTIIQNFEGEYNRIIEEMLLFVSTHFSRLDEEIDFFKISIMTDAEAKEEIIRLFKLNNDEIEDYVEALGCLSMHINNMSKVFELIYLICKFSLTQNCDEEIDVYKTFDSIYEEANAFKEQLKQTIIKHYKKQIYSRSEGKDHILKDCLKNALSSLFDQDHYKAMKYIFMLDASYADKIPDWVLWDIYNEELLNAVKEGE